MATPRCVYCSKKLKPERVIPGVCSRCEDAGYEGLPLR